MFLHFKHCASTTETISIVWTFINEKKKNHLSFKSQTPFCLTKHSRFNYYSSKEASIHHPNPISTNHFDVLVYHREKEGYSARIPTDSRPLRSPDYLGFLWILMLCHSKRPIFILSWPEKKSLWAKWLEIWQNLWNSDSRPFTTTLDKNLIYPFHGLDINKAIEHPGVSESQ